MHLHHIKTRISHHQKVFLLQLATGGLGCLNTPVEAPVPVSSGAGENNSTLGGKCKYNLNKMMWSITPSNSSHDNAKNTNK